MAPMGMPELRSPFGTDRKSSFADLLLPGSNGFQVCRPLAYVTHVCIVEPTSTGSSPLAHFCWFHVALAIRDSRMLLAARVRCNMKQQRRGRHREMGWRARSTELSKRLRSWRKVHKLSQSAAAIRLGMSRRTLQEWEQGRAIPHELVLNALHLLMARKTRRPGS